VKRAGADFLLHAVDSMDEMDADKFIVSLPTMVAETSMDAPSVELLAVYIHEMFACVFHAPS
jgi:hypothetical protein